MRLAIEEELVGQLWEASRQDFYRKKVARRWDILARNVLSSLVCDLVMTYRDYATNDTTEDIWPGTACFIAYRRSPVVPGSVYQSRSRRDARMKRVTHPTQIVWSIFAF